MLEYIEFEGVQYWKVAREYLGRALYTTGFYSVDDVLVDCGPPNARSLLRPVFEKLRVSRVLITHHHEDHTGNAAHLQKHYGLQVLGHAKGARGLAEIARGLPFYRNVIWGTPDALPYDTVAEAFHTSAREFQVIPTPGHSEDHLCFFDAANGWLFTGDLYLSGYLRYLRDDENIYLIMASLRKLMELKPRVLFCNHRGPVADGTAALGRKLSFLESMRDEVLDGFARGMGEGALVRKLLKKDIWFRWVTAGEFSSRNLIRAFARGVPQS